MSAYVLTNSQLLVGAMDLSPFSGEFHSWAETTMKPALNFGALGYNVVLPGLVKATAMVKGYSDFATGAVNATYGSASKGSQLAFSVIAGGPSAVAGSEASMMRGRLSKMKLHGGKAGDVAFFQMDLTGDQTHVDGVLAAPLAVRTTAAFTGTTVLMAAVPAGKNLFAALHVTAGTFTNLAVTVQSANNSGFTSPATAITFATVSAPGWQFLSIPGSYTDSYFRVTGTLASGTATYAAVFGIQ
jgi:hypothetical protein